MPVYRLLFIAILAAPVAAASDGPPNLLRFKHSPAVVSWAAESTAFDSNGHLREDLMSHALRENRKQNAAGTCTHFLLQPSLHIFEPADTLAEIAMNARAVVSGVVVSVSRGFVHGFPGTLVGFRVTDIMRLISDTDATPIARGSIRYTFIGKAEFVTPDGAICSTTAKPVPLPEPGDTILIASYFSPPDEAGLIFPTDSQRHLVVERAGKRLFTPAPLKDDLRDVTLTEAMQRMPEFRNRAQ